MEIYLTIKGFYPSKVITKAGFAPRNISSSYEVDPQSTFVQNFYLLPFYWSIPLILV